jgi:hypothetical protein
MSARTLIAIACLATMGALAPNAFANETVLVCDVYGNHVAPLPSGVLGIGATSICPGNAQSSPPGGGMEIYTVSGRTVSKAQMWHTE